MLLLTLAWIIIIFIAIFIIGGLIFLSKMNKQFGEFMFGVLAFLAVLATIWAIDYLVKYYG
jgi:hypothetical protein